MAASSAAGGVGNGLRAVGRLLDWLERRERLLFALLLALVILPVWLFQYFPAWDSPLHLHMADVMARYGEPGAEILTEYLIPNQTLEPNLAIYYILLFFSSVFDLYTAEKILLTLYAVLLACGARYAIAGIEPRASVLSLLFIPTIFTMFIHMGLYNYCLSVALYLLVFGFWYRRRAAMTPTTLAVLAIAGLLLVLVHLLGFVLLMVTVGAITLFDALHGARSQPREALLALARRSLELGLAMLPGVVVVASFFLRHGMEAEGEFVQDRLDLLLRLAAMDHLYSFARIEVLLYVPFVLLVGGLVVWAAVRRWRDGRRLQTQDGLVFAALVVLLLYFFLPLTTKDVPVSQRLLPFLFALVFFWLATLGPGPWLRRSVVAVVAVVCVATTGYRLWQYDRLNGFLAEYTSAADWIEPDSTLLPIHFWHESDASSGRRLTWRINPLYHAPGHIGVARNVINLRNLFLSPEVLGYFPMRYRPHRDPYVHIGEDIDDRPPAGEFLSYEERTGGTVDYVLVMATEPLAALDHEEADWIAAQLQHGYELIYISQGLGFARLYRRTSDDSEQVRKLARSGGAKNPGPHP
jgi:uncharacterized membrane protein YqhA